MAKKINLEKAKALNSVVKFANDKQVISDKEASTMKFYSFERGVTQAPRFLENWANNGRPYIYNGVDNLYAQEMVRLYLNSSGLHSHLIDKKTAMTAGEGWIKEGLNATTRQWLNNSFAEDTLDTVAKKFTQDLWLQGGAYLMVTWNKTFTYPSRIEYLPYEKVRIGKPDAIGKYVFYVSRDWEFKDRKENKPVVFHPFNQEDAENHPVQIMYVKEHCPGADYYALPSYSKGALNFIKLAFEISVFHLKSIQNGLNAGMIIVNKSGIPSKEERELDAIRFKNRQAGADASGDILFVYCENEKKVPEFIPMPNNGSDARFQLLLEQVNANIRIAHGATAQVANLDTAGKLGSREEISDGYLMFQKSVISPMQKIVEDTFNKLGALGGFDELKLAEYNIFPEESEKYENSTAAALAAFEKNKAASTSILANMTAEEIRGLVGLGVATGQTVGIKTLPAPDSAPSTGPAPDTSPDVETNDNSNT